jgi:kinesin family protein 20
MAETEEVKKCLEFTVTEENEQPLSVYLRIKPPESKDDHPCVCVISETDVEARAPSTSVAFRNNSRRRRPAIYKFSFSHVLSPSSSQGDVFQSTTCPLLERLVNESTSSLIFSFGVTNSGKTFTIEGTRQNSGILPRSLDYVFNSIHKQLSEDVKVRPDKYNDVIVLDEQRSVVEKTMLDELCRSSMSATSDTTSASKTPARSTESTFSADLISAGFSELTDALRLRNRDTSVFTVLNGEADFLVYVSYLEIYNECVYDLLEVSPRKRRQRRALPLSEDKSGNVYIKYLRKVHVGSADDALRALALGKRNRQMATTLFNEESSRR